MLTLGVGLLVLAVSAAQRQPVVAVPTTAVVVHDLTSGDCSAGHQLDVTFRWADRLVNAANSPDCARDYVAGDRIKIFVASDDATDVGPTADWILDPSTQDPFDFIGPNGLPGFAATSGVVAIGVGCTSLFLNVRRNRRRSGC